jgi:hypothetical protein
VRERRDRDWDEWLQAHRIELNAMTTPAFIAWLDRKMAAHIGKLVPPDDVLLEEWSDRLEKLVRERVTGRILREAGLEDLIASEIEAIQRPTACDLAKGIRESFRGEPEAEWRAYIEATAKERM